MTGAFWFWMLIFVIGIALVFCVVVHLVTLTDLESDYINPVDATERLNKFLIPEYVVHTSITVLFLLTLNFIPFLANSLLVAWHAKRFAERQHLLDATSIYPSLAERKKQSNIKLGFYCIMFFYYMYRMVYALVRSRWTPVKINFN